MSNVQFSKLTETLIVQVNADAFAICMLDVAIRRILANPKLYPQMSVVS